MVIVVLGIAAPGQANSGFCLGAQTLQPIAARFFLCPKILWGGRYAFECCPQGQRQAHQGTVTVEVSRCFLGADHPYVRVHALDQAQQRVLDGKDDLCPKCSHQAGVAAELNGVPEALFGVDEQGFPGDAVLAQPFRLRVGALAQGFIEPFAPFLFFPALGKAPEHQQNLGLVAVSFGEIRLAGDRPIVARQRFLVACEVVQGQATVGVRRGKARQQRDRPIIARHRGFLTAQSPQGVAAIAMGVGEEWA